MDIDAMRQQLTERLAENYGDYRATLLLYDRQELIDRAGEIVDTANAYHYLSVRCYTEQELSYLLQFQNPLEVMVDSLRSYEQDYGVLDGLLWEMVDKQDQLSMYPLAKDAPAPKPETQRKFMNVDIESSLKQIMGQMTVHYQTDLRYALDAMHKGARSGSPEEKNFVVFFRHSGVECMNERDLFIGDTQSFNTCQHFYTMNRSEPVFAYAVEVTSDDRGRLRGNLFQVDHHQLAAFAGRAASPLTDVTVKFVEGHEALIPREEYYSQGMNSIEYQYGGHVMGIRSEPEDESVVQSAIRQEHDRRDKLPKGHFAVHVKKLEDSRIQAEADRITEAFQGLAEPNSPDKGSFTVPISADFIALSDQRQMNTLFDKLLEQMPDKPIYIDPSQRDEGKFSIGYHADKVAERASERGEKRESVLGQLSALKASQKDQTAPAPEKKHREESR